MSPLIKDPDQLDRFTASKTHLVLDTPKSEKEVTVAWRPTAPYVEGVEVFVEVSSGDKLAARMTIDRPDFWADFTMTHPDYKWIDENTLGLGRKSDFDPKQTGTLVIENSTGELIPITTCHAGNQIFIVLDLDSGESRRIGCPLNT